MEDAEGVLESTNPFRNHRGKDWIREESGDTQSRGQFC